MYITYDNYIGINFEWLILMDYKMENNFNIIIISIFKNYVVKQFDHVVWKQIIITIHLLKRSKEYYNYT